MWADYCPADLDTIKLTFSQKKCGWQEARTRQVVRLRAWLGEHRAFSMSSWRLIHTQLSEAGKMRKTEYNLLFTNGMIYNVIQHSENALERWGSSYNSLWICGRKYQNNLCWLSSACSEVGPSGTPVRCKYCGTWWTSTFTFGVIRGLCVRMAPMNFSLNEFISFSNSGSKILPKTTTQNKIFQKMWSWGSGGKETRKYFFQTFGELKVNSDLWVFSFGVSKCGQMYVWNKLY